RAGRAGVHRSGPPWRGCPPPPAAGLRPVEPGADGLGERAPARSLPAAVQPARAVPDLAAGSGGVPPAPRAVRVLGARGLPDTGRAASVPALADGPGAPARLGADAPGRDGEAGAGRLGP